MTPENSEHKKTNPRLEEESQFCEIAHLLKENNELKEVLLSIPQIIFLVQTKDDFVYFTNCYSPEERLLMPKSSFIGRKVSEIFPAPISNPLEESINTMLSSNLNEFTYEYNLKILGFDNFFQANVKKIEDGTYIVSVTDITPYKKIEEKLTYASTHDFLTGLYNRMYFEDKLREMDAPNNLPISIIFADLNELKHVNDTLGHQKGDDLIKTIANILKKSFREQDIISRWGGDEFVVLLTKTPYEVAQKRTKIVSEMCNISNLENPTRNYELSISLGLATKELAETSLDSILIRAENLMYKTKKSNKT
ncbi:MAG TPA: GGDEF domain-containing protein [Candidatus Woesearchaeota archaeon]|nr:GGDEF domain-containing protein [Candidatus Woesearchaeota archaeon]